VNSLDQLRRLIERAYPEIEILADVDGHGFGRELHVRNGRGFQGILRNEAELFRWFGRREAAASERRPAVVVQRNLF